METDTFRRMTPDARTEYLFSQVEALLKETTSLRRDINALHRAMGNKGGRSKKKKRAAQSSEGPEG